MARTRKTPVEKLPPVADEVLDQFGPATGMSMEDINAATRRLKQALIERMLGGELSHHLGYPPGGARREDADNHRNGASPKTVVTDDGPVAIAVPRDRAGTFAPVLIPKHARRLAGFDDKVLALYARGRSTLSRFSPRERKCIDPMRSGAVPRPRLPDILKCPHGERAAVMTPQTLFPRARIPYGTWGNRYFPAWQTSALTEGTSASSPPSPWAGSSA